MDPFSWLSRRRNISRVRLFIFSWYLQYLCSRLKYRVSIRLEICGWRWSHSDVLRQNYKAQIQECWWTTVHQIRRGSRQRCDVWHTLWADEAYWARSSDPSAFQYAVNSTFLISRIEVAKFFQPSIDCIIQAVMVQRKTAHKKITVND